MVFPKPVLSYPPFPAGLWRIAAILLLMFFINIQAASAATPSLMILPPVNKTGAADLDWLSIGIQGAMTVNLWGVSSVQTLDITDYGRHLNYSREIICRLDLKGSLDLAQQAKVSQIWRGEYSLADKNTIILTYSAIDAVSGKLLQTREIKAILKEAPQLVSQITISMISAAGFQATEQELSRISKPQTISIEAFEQHSLGFSRHLQMFAGRRHMSSDRRMWVEHSEKAVALDPLYAEAFVTLGWAYHANRSLDDAFKAFSTAVKLNPYLPEAWMGLGYIQREYGRSSIAIDSFQKAIALNGNLEWPRQELNNLIAAAPPVEPPKSAPQFKSSEEFASSLSDMEKKLLLLAEQESLETRLEAIKSLVRAKGAASLPFLKQMINRQDQAFEVLKLMADIDIPETMPFAVEALEKRCALPDGSRLSGLTEENILGVLQFLRRRTLNQATPVVIRLLNDSSPAIRESAAQTLGDFAKQEAVEPLRTLAASERNQFVRVSALVALVSLGDSGARLTLKGILDEGLDMKTINYTLKLLKQRNLKIVER